MLELFFLYQTYAIRKFWARLVGGAYMPDGKDILLTLIELLETQEQIKITCEIREVANSNGTYDAGGTRKLA